MNEPEERVLNQETWRLEAESAINDIRGHVAKAFVSTNTANSNRRVYINLTTLENKDYCIEMSAAGFRIVGLKHDDVTLLSFARIYYETPYAILNRISDKYRESFGGELMNKLLELAKMDMNKAEQ